MSTQNTIEAWHRRREISIANVNVSVYGVMKALQKEYQQEMNVNIFSKKRHFLKAVNEI